MPSTPMPTPISAERAAAQAIERRSIERADAPAPLLDATARAMATADAHDFVRLLTPWRQADAAVNLAEAARASTAYRDALEAAVPGTAAQVAALDQANNRAIAAKEERKQGMAVHNQVASAQDPLKSLAPTTPTMPPDLARHYLRIGRTYYHRRHPTVPAFEDRGHVLETRSDSPAIAHTLVQLALARDWQTIRVTGSEVFRRQVWLAAAAQGIQVQGYQPTAHEQTTRAAPAPDPTPLAATLARMDRQAQADGLNPAQRQDLRSRLLARLLRTPVATATNPNPTPTRPMDPDRERSR